MRQFISFFLAGVWVLSSASFGKPTIQVNPGRVLTLEERIQKHQVRVGNQVLRIEPEFQRQLEASAEQFLATNGRRSSDDGIPVFMLTIDDRAKRRLENQYDEQIQPGRFEEAWDLTIKHLPADTMTYLSSPLRWDAKDWLIAAGVVAGTGALFFVDRKVQKFAEDHRSGLLDKVSYGIGGLIPYLGTLSAYYIGGFAFGDARFRRTVVASLEAVALASGILSPAVDILTQRDKPYANGNDPWAFHGPGFDIKRISFLSGHTAANFSIASVLGAEYGGDHPWIPVIAYTYATLLGLQRIYNESHWASDVFIGAAVGFFTGQLVHRLNRKRFFKKFKIYPYTDARRTGGVALTYVWD